MAKLAAKADFQQLTRLFGLSSSTSRKIINFTGRSEAKSIDSYRQVLSNQELLTVTENFSKANKETVTKVLKGDKQRDTDPR